MPAQWGEECCRAGEGGPKGGGDTWQGHTIQPQKAYNAEELWTQKQTNAWMSARVSDSLLDLDKFWASPSFVFPVCKMSRWNALGAWTIYFATLFWSHLFRLVCILFINHKLAFPHNWDNTWEVPSLPSSLYLAWASLQADGDVRKRPQRHLLCRSLLNDPLATSFSNCFIENCSFVYIPRGRQMCWVSCQECCVLLLDGRFLNLCLPCDFQISSSSKRLSWVIQTEECVHREQWECWVC